VVEETLKKWNWWPLFPLYPYGKKKTILKELIPESKSALVLCITRKDACFFAPGDEADPLYGNLFRESLSAGMITIPCSFEFHKDHISWRGIKPLK